MAFAAILIEPEQFVAAHASITANGVSEAPIAGERELFPAGTAERLFQLVEVSEPDWAWDIDTRRVYLYHEQRLVEAGGPIQARTVGTRTEPRHSTGKEQS